MFDLHWRPPILLTARLALRPYEEADAPLLYPHASNPNSTRFTLWEHHRSLDDTYSFTRDHALSRYAEGVPEPMAIAWKDDPRQPIGSSGCYWAAEPHRCMELGYWLAEPFWGRGIVVEACRKLLEYVFAEFAPRRIQARVIEGNAASIRVLEKIGFQQDGFLRSALFRRGRFENVHLFSMLDEDWKTDDGERMPATSR